MRNLKIWKEERRAGEGVGENPIFPEGNFKNRAEYEHREK